MEFGGGGSDGYAITIAIYAALTYDIISATNSSPQTTEINAQKRASTLMKWVYIGLVQAVLFAGIGYFFEVKSGRPGWPPVMGVAIAGTLLYFQYVYAKQSGLDNGGASTETY